MNNDTNVIMEMKETVCKGCIEVERAFLSGEADSVATTTADALLRKGLAACRSHVENVIKNIGEMNQDINNVMDGWSDQFFEVLRLLCFSPGCVSGCRCCFFSLVLLCIQMRGDICIDARGDSKSTISIKVN